MRSIALLLTALVLAASIVFHGMAGRYQLVVVSHRSSDWAPAVYRIDRLTGATTRENSYVWQPPIQEHDEWEEESR